MQKSVESSFPLKSSYHIFLGQTAVKVDSLSVNFLRLSPNDGLTGGQVDVYLVTLLPNDNNGTVNLQFL